MSSVDEDDEKEPWVKASLMFDEKRRARCYIPSVSNPNQKHRLHKVESLPVYVNYLEVGTYNNAAQPIPIEALEKVIPRANIKKLVLDTWHEFDLTQPYSIKLFQAIAASSIRILTLNSRQWIKPLKSRVSNVVPAVKFPECLSRFNIDTEITDDDDMEVILRALPISITHIVLRIPSMAMFSSAVQRTILAATGLKQFHLREREYRCCCAFFANIMEIHKDTLISIHVPFCLEHFRMLTSAAMNALRLESLKLHKRRPWREWGQENNDAFDDAERHMTVFNTHPSIKTLEVTQWNVQAHDWQFMIDKKNHPRVKVMCMLLGAKVGGRCYSGVSLLPGDVLRQLNCYLLRPQVVGFARVQGQWY
jgi:hypothetical protein